MQQPPYDPNQPTWQGLPQQSLPSSPGWQPPQPLPPKKRHRRWPWLIGILIGALVLCTIISVAAANTPQAAQSTPTPSPTAAAVIVTATPSPAQVPTASSTPKPTPKPTVLAVKPTPRPTQKPKPTPTPKPHCVAVNNNPWCYNFSPGGLIYTPPSGFCSYFNCIAAFYASDDPGDGYIVECADSTFSQSGGESGACSHHGGVMRPLYSH